jgi:hypothetical protein
VVFERVGLLHRPAASISRQPAAVSGEVFGASGITSPIFVSADFEAEETVDAPSRPSSTPAAQNSVQWQVQLPPPGLHGNDEEEEFDDEEEVLPTPPLHFAARHPAVKVPALPTHEEYLRQTYELPAFPQFENDYLDDELSFICPQLFPAPPLYPSLTSFASAPQASAPFATPVPVYAQSKRQSSSLKRHREDYISTSDYDEEPMYKIHRSSFPSY